MSQHTVRSFDDDLSTLGRKIDEMGGISEEMFAQSIDALVRRDLSKAQTIVLQDARLDALQAEIEELAVQLVARRQPMANDLRRVMGSVRIATDLERVGDLVKNIAKRVIAMEDAFFVARSVSGIQHLSHLVQAQLKSVLDALSQNKPDLARQVWTQDGEVDALHNSLFRELLTYMMEDPRSITLCAHLLFVAKNIERIGDQATNIAETVYYIETGTALTGTRPKVEPDPVALTPSDE